ncbi:MAG: flippase-like domain-containing protein [Bacteroidales bacterium]|nr:flippase-like domain-containing protein [Bacteroidales bacterium]
MEQSTNKFGEIVKKILKFILFFGIGAFFIWLSVRKLSPDDVENLKESAAQVTRGSAWIFLFLAFLVGAISNYIRALRNRQLLQPLGYETRTSMVFYSVMVMYLANYAFPRLGEVLRCTFLQRYEKVPFEKSLGTVVTERAVDLICLIIVFISAFAINTGLLDTLKIGDVTLRESMNAKFSGMAHNYTMFILIGAIVAFIVIAVLTKKWWSKINFFVKIKNFFVGIWQGLVSIKDLKNPGLFLVYTVSIWILWIFETVFCFQAFDFLSGMSFTVMFSVFAIGNLGFLIGPGGIGAYPLIVAAMLVLYGVDYSAGLAAGWIGWGVQTLQVLVLGVFSLIATSFVKRKE